MNNTIVVAAIQYILVRLLNYCVRTSDFSTWNTSVADVQIGREVFRTRLDEISQRGNAEFAGALTRARPVEQVEHIRRTADVSVVTCHAPVIELICVRSIYNSDNDDDDDDNNNNNPRESAFQFQRLSVVIQRYNAVAIQGTLVHTTPEDDF